MCGRGGVVVLHFDVCLVSSMSPTSPIRAHEASRHVAPVAVWTVSCFYRKYRWIANRARCGPSKEGEGQTLDRSDSRVCAGGRGTSS